MTNLIKIFIYTFTFSIFLGFTGVEHFDKADENISLNPDFVEVNVETNLCGCVEIGVETDWCFKWSPIDEDNDFSISKTTICVSEEVTYQLYISDNNGDLISIYSYKIVLAEEPLPVKYIVQCDSGESISLDAGSGFETYLWSTGQVTQTISVLTSGEFTVTVTDDENCQSIATAIVANGSDFSQIESQLLSHGFSSIPITVTSNPAFNGSTPQSSQSILNSSVIVENYSNIEYLWDFDDYSDSAVSMENLFGNAFEEANQYFNIEGSESLSGTAKIIEWEQFCNLNIEMDDFLNLYEADLGILIVFYDNVESEDDLMFLSLRRKSSEYIRDKILQLCSDPDPLPIDYNPNCDDGGLALTQCCSLEDLGYYGIDQVEQYNVPGTSDIIHVSSQCVDGEYQHESLVPLTFEQGNFDNEDISWGNMQIPTGGSAGERMVRYLNGLTTEELVENFSHNVIVGAEYTGKTSYWSALFDSGIGKPNYTPSPVSKEHAIDIINRFNQGSMEPLPKDCGSQMSELLFKVPRTQQKINEVVSILKDYYISNMSFYGLQQFLQYEEGVAISRPSYRKVNPEFDFCKEDVPLWAHTLLGGTQKISGEITKVTPLFCTLNDNNAIRFDFEGKIRIHDPFGVSFTGDIKKQWFIPGVVDQWVLQNLKNYDEYCESPPCFRPFEHTIEMKFKSINNELFFTP